MENKIKIDGSFSHSYTVPTCKKCFDDTFEVRQIKI